MLQKHYPLAIIGKSYLSLLYGIELLRYFERVLLLDDDRLSFGDLYQTGVTQIDYAFLETWGNDRSIELLKSGEFLHRSPYFLYCGGTQLYLGRSPWDNLQELTRKLHQLFPYTFLFQGQETADLEGDSQENLKWSSQEINKDYRLFCERLGLNGLRFKSIDNFTYEYLMGHCPESIKILFKLFQRQMSLFPEFGRSFQYFGRILFHKKLASSYTDLELFHFFLCIIGPHYELDIHALSDYLSHVFSERGGHYKHAQVREWKFYKYNPWSIELSSFEGIIHPQKISFLGSHPTGLPLKIEYKGKTFLTVHFSMECNDERIKGDHFNEGIWNFIGDIESLGTDLPFCKFRIQAGHIKGHFLYREKKGSKLDFYKMALLDKLTSHLEQLYPGITTHLDKFNLKRGCEVYMDQSDCFHAPDTLKINQVGLYDFSIPTVRKRLKNVYYYGPLKNGSLGVFGQLMEIKESPKYQ